MAKKGNGTEEETIEYYEGLEEDRIRTIKTDKIDLEKNEFEFRLLRKTSDLRLKMFLTSSAYHCRASW